MSTVILSCTSLADYVRAAQQKMGTDYPVVTIDKSHHREPEQMKALVAKMIDDFAPEVDTVLVATGFCGGLWDHVTAARRLVIPRVDDCVSTVLHMDDEYHPNLKEPGHLYMFEDVPDSFWYASDVRFVTEEKLMNGVGDGLFAPDRITDRAMLVTILLLNC